MNANLILPTNLTAKIMHHVELSFFSLVVMDNFKILYIQINIIEISSCENDLANPALI